jgi:hypothetical protein
MNSKIKLALVGTVLLTIIGYSFQSCSNEDEMDTDVAANINIDFEKIGREHNKGLDYIYEQLKKNQEGNSVKLRSTTSSFDIAEDASVQFVTASDYGKGIEKEKMYEIVKLSSERISLRSANANEIINTDNLEFLTDKQQQYLNKYKEIIKSTKKDLDPVIEKLKKLDIEIISNCTSEEAIPLLAATSVGRHSLQYWNDNLYKWIALLDPDTKKIESALVPRLKSGTIEVQTNDEEWEWFYDTLTSMGQSDGIGALIGGISGLAGGIVGAIPGALVGACNASAGAGIKALFNKWGIF